MIAHRTYARRCLILLVFLHLLPPLNARLPPKLSKPMARPIESNCPDVEAGHRYGTADIGRRGTDYHCACTPIYVGVMFGTLLIPISYCGSACMVYPGSDTADCSIASHCTDDPAPAYLPFEPARKVAVPTFGSYCPCSLRPFGC